MKYFKTILGLAFLLAGPARAATIFTQTFDDVTNLGAAGWVQTNNSSPLGLTGWFQGNTGVFSSQAGAGNSYIAANFENAAFGGNISNWLLTPVIALANGTSINFYTRTVDVPAFADRLEVRLSTNGASSNVGATAASVGDFTTLLLGVNPALGLAGYPNGWTLFSATLSGLGGPTTGRFGFRYFVTDTSVNADYIGIDTLTVNDASGVPEPGTLAMLGLGLAALALIRRVRNPGDRLST